MPESSAVLTASVVVSELLVGFSNSLMQMNTAIDPKTNIVSNKLMPSLNSVKAIISGIDIPLIINERWLMNVILV